MPRVTGSAEAYLLGFWLGDGSIHKRGAFFFAGDPVQAAFEEEYESWCGDRPKRISPRSNVTAYWSRKWGDRLRELGYGWPCRAEDKEIKCQVPVEFTLPLLEGLWDTDGTVVTRPTYANVRYGYCRSQRLCQQIIEKLALMQVEARIGTSKTPAGKPIWAVNVRKKHHRYLAERMCLAGEKGRRLSSLRN